MVTAIVAIFFGIGVGVSGLYLFLAAEDVLARFRRTTGKSPMARIDAILAETKRIEDEEISEGLYSL